MDLSGQASQARFASYVEALVEVIGQADRAEPLNDYCVGLLMPGERRASSRWRRSWRRPGFPPNINRFYIWSARRPGRTRPFCKRSASWFCLASNDKGGSKPGSSMTPVLRRRARIRSASRDNIVGGSANRTIVKSRLRCRSPIIRQACRSLTGSICRRHGQMMQHGGKNACAERYQVQNQAADRARSDPRSPYGGRRPGIVLADAGDGANSDFRAGVSALNLPYVVGIQSTPSVWPPGQAPLPPKPWSGRGRRPCNVQRDDEHKPVSVKDLALSLGKKAWRSVTWREG